MAPLALVQGSAGDGNAEGGSGRDDGQGKHAKNATTPTEKAARSVCTEPASQLDRGTDADTDAADKNNGGENFTIAGLTEL